MSPTEPSSVCSTSSLGNGSNDTIDRVWSRLLDTPPTTHDRKPLNQGNCTRMFDMRYEDLGKMAVLRIILGIVWALAFFAAAAVQYNDPDPLLWGVFYAFAAVVAFGSDPLRTRYVFERWRRTILLVALGFGGWSLWGCYSVLEPSAASLDWAEVFGDGGMMSRGVEEMREALGALVVAARLGWVMRRNRSLP